MARKPLMELKCENCGKPQPTNKEKSTANWSVFDCNAKCECGGKYVMHIDGQKVG